MPRLAWFTPGPTSHSGIAAYSEEILPILAARYQLDVFTTPLGHGQSGRDGHPPVFEAHDFAWKHFTSPYDLVVYQLGNAMCHSFMWPYLFRHPGLVVLHDGQLHHSRARQLLAHGRGDDYRAEFRANHPGAPEDAAELVIGDLAESLYYFWPMLKLVVESSRLMAVHSTRLAHELHAEFGRAVHAIHMGVRDPRSAAGAGPEVDPIEARRARRRAIRARHGIPEHAVVFSAFGLVTPEKRVSTILQVMPAVLAEAPDARLMLVGGVTEHYEAVAEARSLGVADRVVVTGWVPDDEVPDHLGASDVAICLRWPSGRETSASWLRAIANGLATVVTDLAHVDEMAFLDPRTWTVQRAASGERAEDATPRPVCVGIDILDERHSLGLALVRLATDAPLRVRLGLAARAHWEAFHTIARMADDYAVVIDHALARPAVPPRGLPPHLVRDGTEVARRLLDDMGVGVDFLRETRSLWPNRP
jgi:glycosyltransferase involved in cell wall biosynthesis